jgi:hypothetical protein
MGLLKGAFEKLTLNVYTMAMNSIQFVLLFYVSAQKDGGTQIKLVIDYDDGSQALFKPMR